jgi:hypothetical protein
MPNLNHEIADTVFYLYRRHPKHDKIDGPIGTGSIVARPSRLLDEELHYYGITNWHLSHDQGASIIRLNTRDGSSRLLEYGPEDWQFITDHDDLSAIDLTDDLKDTDQIAVFPESSFTTPNLIREMEISFGDDMCMIGMFVDHYGGKRNKPAARFGNLSLLADKDALVRQPNEVMRPSHLIDMRSRTGFSGSPVVVFRHAPRLLGQVQMFKPFSAKQSVYTLGGQVTNDARWYTALFGIHCGQYKDEVKVFRSAEEKFGDPIREGDSLYIQSGMTIVVPAWRISELLDLEVFETRRRTRDELRGTRK